MSSSPARPRRLGRRPLAVALLLTGVLAAQHLTPLSPSALAAPQDPLRGRGVVTSVPDGDTVRIDMEGSTATPLVRLAGIQAFETSEGCNATLATNRLRTLVNGKRVELRSRYAGSSSDGRPVRSLHVGGTDINERMLRDGMGLWFPLANEITATARYHAAADEARAAGRGIWADTRCGQGPSHGVKLQMWVKSDADSDDGSNVNGEYVVVVNRDGSKTVDLSGWRLRESSQFRASDSAEGYVVPSGTVLSPGQRVRFRVGRGSDTASTKYMNSPAPLFDNTNWATGTGDGAYLIDTLGNIRQSFSYPCTIDCSTPLAGKLRIDRVEFDPPGADTADTEFVRLRNVSSQRLALDGYQLRKLPYAHEFRANTYLDPNETLTVYVGKGTSSRTVQYWGSPGSGSILANNGDVVEVLSWDERVVDCRSWGGRSCFRDVSSSNVHHTNIRNVSDLEVASGYPDRTYRPEKGVSREQMGTFLARAMELPGVAGSPFSDVPSGGVHSANIAAVAKANVAGGYPDGTYRPRQIVTRAQMATFLARAAGLPPVSKQRFSDVDPNSVHAGAINAVAQAGIAAGRKDGTYKPDEPVTRDQMATFLSRLMPYVR